MSHDGISPLRRRMIEDMTIRQFGEHTLRDYVRQVREFTAFLGRSPDGAEPEDLRRYRLHLASLGASYVRMNLAGAALRFFFHDTRTAGFGDRMARIPSPERLPVVLSPEEVALLLAHASSLKYRAALSVEKAPLSDRHRAKNRYRLIRRTEALPWHGPCGPADRAMALKGMSERQLTVALIDPNPTRASILQEGLYGSGVQRVIVLPDTVDLLRRLGEVDPDVVVIDLDSPSRDLLEQLFHVSRLVERPVAMFVDQSDAAMMQAAVDAGISAYVVDGLKPERVRSIVDVAILRFNAFARLQRELKEARSELAARKVIERAKGILMRLKGLGEDEAYALLRKRAMNEGRKIADIAQALVTSADLLE